VLGDLLLAQRGGLRKSEAALADPTFAWQALCLRLAVIKCHARRPINSQMLELKAQRQTARLRYPVEWAERNPRTVHLLREEVEAWVKVNALALSIP
jgi:exopolyphosphatase/guanosine-5'-triphosphate,3'-diphosphate pyrophosphatase